MPQNRPMLITVIAALSVSSSLAELVVNELMASNQATLADTQGEFDDWVEIYNPGASNIDLRGYFVSDDADDQTKWSISVDEPLIVPAGGYSLLWLDNDLADGADHLPFRLAAEGDIFILTAPDGATVIEQIQLPVQHPDISYGRSQDHGGQFRYLINPTPGAVNDPLGVAVLEGITCSNDGGTFVEAFSLALATTSDGAAIRYSLDGSLPTSATGYAYDAPVTIDASTCLRTALFLGATQISPVETRVFLALDETLASFDSNLPIVLIESQGYDFAEDSVRRSVHQSRSRCRLQHGSLSGRLRPDREDQALG